MTSGKLPIGTVVRAHGVRGLVRVRASSDALLALARVFVDGREHAVEHAQAERGDFLVKLAGVADRDQAEALRGKTLEALREELPALGDGELYAADLVGCQVYDAQGIHLGAVTGSFPGGGHEVLEVKLPDGDGRTFLLPLIEPIVREVDVGERRIVCDPPEGLVDLDRAESTE
jgi:16S rRNA processing protein RimM